jgi:chemotaxis protein CheD
MRNEAQAAERDRRELVVRAAECQFADANGRLRAYGIASDVAVVIHAAGAGLSALVRFTRPDSKADPELARENPWVFADTALPLVLSLLRRYGAEDSGIAIHAISGGDDWADEDSAALSAENQAALRRVLSKENLTLAGEDLAGEAVKSLWFDVASGRLLVRSKARSPKPVEVLMLESLAS